MTLEEFILTGEAAGGGIDEQSNTLVTRIVPVSGMTDEGIAAEAIHQGVFESKPLNLRSGCGAG